MPLFKISGLQTVYLESLWNLLSLKHVLLLTEHGQDPFDRLQDDYRDFLDLNDFGIISEGKEVEEINKLIMERIRNGKKYLNVNNMHNLLDFLYKFIVYKLIPASEMQSEARGDEDVQFDGSLLILHLLTPDAVEDLENHFELEFNDCNLDNFRLKHIYQLWKFLVKIYLEIKSN